jgi:hypothetical protein
MLRPLAPPLALLLSLLAAPGAARAELAPDAPSPSLLMHPAGPGQGRLAVGIGVAADVQRYATDGMAPIIPMVEVRLRYGLTKGFGLAAEARTLVLANEASLGVGWGTTIPGAPRLSVAARVMGGLQFGWLVGSGFNTISLIPLIKPSFTIGLALHDGLRLSVREQLVLTAWQFVDNGGTWTSNKQRDVFSGFDTMLTLENLLDRGGNVYFGAAAIFDRPMLTLWLPFAPQSDLYFFPRFFCGYVF